MQLLPVSIYLLHYSFNLSKWKLPVSRNPNFMNHWVELYIFTYFVILFLVIKLVLFRVSISRTAACVFASFSHGAQSYKTFRRLTPLTWLAEQAPKSFKIEPWTLRHSVMENSLNITVHFLTRHSWVKWNWFLFMSLIYAR